MYIILWKDKSEVCAKENPVYNWTAYHPVWDSLDDAEEWLEEYKKEYGKHYDYKLAKLSFLD